MLTTSDAATFLGLFLLLLAGIGLAWEHFSGPDPDLNGKPWFAADPEPGPRRRPCLTAGCRIDHDEITESERRLMDGNR